MPRIDPGPRPRSHTKRGEIGGVHVEHLLGGRAVECGDEAGTVPARELGVGVGREPHASRAVAAAQEPDLRNAPHDAVGRDAVCLGQRRERGRVREQAARAVGVRERAELFGELAEAEARRSDLLIIGRSAREGRGRRRGVGVRTADGKGAAGACKAARGVEWQEEMGLVGEHDEGSDGGEGRGVHGDGGGVVRRHGGSAFYWKRVET